MPKNPFKPGKKLSKVMNRLINRGWRQDGNSWISPHTKINYFFTQACNIEDIKLPNERPGDSLWNWLKN